VQVFDGDIEGGVTYEVEGGSTVIDYVVYPYGSGETYVNGERFVGKEGDTAIDIGGDCTVWRLIPGQMYTPAGQDYWTGIADVIAHEAPERGFTNQWLIDCQFHAYHPSESSLWKPGAYSDYFPFINRCHFCSSDLEGDDEFVLTLHGGARRFAGVRWPAWMRRAKQLE